MGKPTPLSGLMEIDPYTPGKSKLGSGPVHKLSSNESALGASPRAVAAYEDAAATMAKYPDGTATDVKAAISEVHGLRVEELIIGAGSDDIINLIIRAYAAPGDNIVQSAHGFSYYQLAAKAARAEIRFAQETDLTADISSILNEVDERTRIVFLANPNNPTGTVLMRNAIEALRERLRDDIILVLDGAYAEYVETPDYSDGEDLVKASIAADQDNVVMMRTFSKIYGLGGLRVGWAYAPRSIIDVLERLRSPFNVSGPGLAAATAAMRDQDFVQKNREHNRVERDRVAGSLTQWGFKVTPSYGNFVLFDMKTAEKAKTLLGFLEERRVLIRSGASSGLPAHLRVSIGSTEANTTFLEAVRAFTEQS